MRFLLARLGLRGGIILALVLVIAAVVAVGRVAGGPSSPPLAPGYLSPPAISTVTSTAGDDGVRATPAIRVNQNLVLSRADAFMTAWLNRHDSKDHWHAALVPLSTQRLQGSLSGVDPLSVPATRVTGAGEVTMRSDSIAEVLYDVDTGRVTLTLLRQDEWLVDGVDWERL